MSNFRRMSIIVNNPKHSKQIQEFLFSQGYTWAGGEQGFKHTDEYSLATDEKGSIYYSVDMIAVKKWGGELTHFQLVPTLTQIVEIDGRFFKANDVLRFCAPIVGDV